LGGGVQKPKQRQTCGGGKNKVGKKKNQVIGKVTTEPKHGGFTRVGTASGGLSNVVWIKIGLKKR